MTACCRRCDKLDRDREKSRNDERPRMTQQELSLLALWTWFRNHPTAEFAEFSAVFRRAKSAVNRSRQAGGAG